MDNKIFLYSFIVSSILFIVLFIYLLRQTIKKWWRIYIQCKVTVLDILQYADKHRREGLCWSFSDACYHYGVRTSAFKDKCTQFSNDNAYEFGAKASSWWWKPNVWDTGREEFLHYLIDYYSKHEPIYLDNI